MAARFHKLLLNGETAVDTKGNVGSHAPQSDRITFHLKWGTGVTAGAVVIEVADSDDYTGTWSNLDTMTYSTGSPHADHYVATGPFLAIRARISTLVEGGTVSVAATCY